jgi:hypothetical protein
MVRRLGSQAMRREAAKHSTAIERATVYINVDLRKRFL